MKALSAALVVAVALLLPELAAACPMCTSGQGAGGTSRAFAIGSIFLSVTPLAVIGFAAWWLRRRARALHEAARESRPTPSLR